MYPPFIHNAYETPYLSLAQVRRANIGLNEHHLFTLYLFSNQLCLKYATPPPPLAPSMSHPCASASSPILERGRFPDKGRPQKQSLLSLGGVSHKILNKISIQIGYTCSRSVLSKPPRTPPPRPTLTSLGCYCSQCL